MDENKIITDLRIWPVADVTRIINDHWYEMQYVSLPGQSSELLKSTANLKKVAL